MPKKFAKTVATKLRRISAGHYECGDWSVVSDDGAEVGYKWTASHPDNGEHFFSTLADARRFVVEH